jgi:methionyl-tRNA formyltransferase
MNIVFMGTPEFAMPSLKALCENFTVTAVFTQPDKPKGRGKKLALSPVKEFALSKDIKIYQPVKIKNEPQIIQELRELRPDFIIVVAFGQILSKEVLDIPKYGCINLHASLLPKYRGAAPINWCIIKGEKYSGNTTMLMDVGLDTGDMLLKSKYEISEDMTAGELHDILMEDGAGLLVKTINGVIEGNITPEKQNNEEIIYASMLDKNLAKINWNSSALNIKDLIRGLNPWPIAFTTFKGENMRIYNASVIDKDSTETPGTILGVSKAGIKVSTAAGILVIEVIQFPGGKALKVEDYIRGNQIEEGIVLE